jgi:2-polyprenyl-3-methyl-5-hydroxy-6-metoxy-1,4-benzoquinol methylase
MNSLQCPVCFGGRLKNLGTKNGYPIYRCLECTHIFAGNVKLASTIEDAEEFRQQITNGMAVSDQFQYEHLCRAEVEGAHVFLTTRRILQDLQNQRYENKEWLDIGCGSGYLLASLKNCGVHPTGIEPGGWGQIAAREKKVHVVHGLLDYQTFPKKFDYVSATDVLEHQSDPYVLMKLIRHYLADDGRAYLSFPLADTIRPRLMGVRWAMVMPPTHCGFFTRKSFARLASKVGLKIEQFVQYNSSAFRGWSRLGFKFSTANKICDFLGVGDQGLVAISLDKGQGPPCDGCAEV